MLVLFNNWVVIKCYPYTQGGIASNRKLKIEFKQLKMKHKKLKIGVLLLGLGLTAQAQEAFTATGGDAAGSGGTVTYSIGQVVCTTNTGTSGSVAEGVQEPFEIQTVLGTELFTINLNMFTYPNPTTDILNLSIGESELLGMSYDLIDFSGRIIKSSVISNQSTTIYMSEYPASVYILNISQNNKTIKTFKIIKK